VGGQLEDHAEDFVLAEDDVLDAVDLDLGAAVLAEEDPCCRLDFERADLAVVEDLAVADGDDFALDGLLLGESGMMMPPLERVSASWRLTRSRSWRGRNFITLCLRSPVLRHGLYWFC
jgi:hypothetical protein